MLLVMDNILSLLQEEYRLLSKKKETVAELIRLYKNGSVPPVVDIDLLLRNFKPALHPDFPYTSRWPEKIFFLLRQENKPITTNELVDKLSAYEPHIPLQVIKKAIYNTYPRMVQQKAIGMTGSGRYRQYFIEIDGAI